MTTKPAVSLAAVPGRRQTTVELAQRPEQEGFTGIYCPSIGDVREGIQAWYATGVNTLIVVPSSTRGGQMVAFQELIAAFS